MKRAVVEEVSEYDNASRAALPKLVEFASGDRVPVGAKFRSWRSKTDGSRVLTADTQRLSYVNRSPPQDMMLAIVNRSTGKARLVPLEAYHLSPIIEDTTPVDTTDTSASRPTREDVGLTMGLSRWQKMYAKSQKLQVNAAAASVSAALSEAVKGVADDPAPLQEPQTAVAGEADLIPPQNSQASDPSEVYSRDDVIPPMLWSLLVEHQEYFKNILGTAGYDNEYLVKYAAAFSAIGDTDSYIILSYLAYMLRIQHYLKAMKIRMQWKQLGIPEPILEHLRESFMERSQEGWGRSDRLNIKLGCYLIVVMLWLHDYKLDLNEVATASRIQLKRLQMLCAALGLTVVGEAQAELKLPLKERVQPTNSRRQKKISQL